MAGHLCDLQTGEVLASAGAMNPQIRFGEDLMSRVSYVMMHPGSEAELTAAIRTCIDGLIADLCAQAGADATDLLELTIVGNPIMHHLFLGLDPTELGGAPFALATDEAVHRSARELDLTTTNAGARVYVLPCIAGHVGADTAGVILSEAPHDQDTVNLIVDVGTNAEIVLGNRDRLLAASSPTGPAFEGAQISCGQRAAPGAIERVRIDRETLEPKFRVIGDDRWSDEPGFDASSVTGVAGSGIIEAIAELFLAGVITTDGVIDGSLADRSDRIVADERTFTYVLHDAPGVPRLAITQNDVRQIQLAKGALYAGCRLLMDALGIETVDRIRLAGAFGAHIDPVHAMVLGLVPDCDPEHVTSAGNAAGTGARIALLNRAARDEIEAVVRRVEKLETAVEPRFQEHFVGAMGIPHATDPFPRLGAAVDMPPPRPSRRAIAPDAVDAPATTRGAAHERRHRSHARGGAAPASHRRPGGACGRPPRRGRRAGALHHPPADAGRGGERGGHRDDRAQRRHDPRAGRHRLPRGARRARAAQRGRLRRRRRAGAVPSRVGSPARAGHGAPRVRPGRPQPANTVHLGGAATVLAPAYGSPFVRDLDGGRRYGTIEDFRNFVKLAYASPFLHHSGGTVCEPVDLPVNKRHFDMVYAHMRYSDKPFMGSVTHPQRAQDTVEMARILFGADALEARPHVLSLINANSPLVWDTIMLGAAKAYAEANQAVIMTPFILAGAMSPATAAGAATQTLAEALAGMAYVQLVRPGAPVVFGSFASSMSMQSGAPTFGTPEPALVLYALAACARRLGVPFRSGGSLTASKVADAQAAYESANTLQPTILAGVNFVLHAAGWLEGGLAMGYEKFVLDLDQCGQMHALANGHGPLTERPGDRCDRGERARAALPRHGAHARELRDRLLPVGDRRQQLVRAVGAGRLAGRRDARERRLEAHARRVRGAADRRGQGRGAARVDRAEEGELPGLERVTTVTRSPARVHGSRRR